MGKRNRQRQQAIRYGLATPISLQRKIDEVEVLSEKYGGPLVAQVIKELQQAGRMKPFWGQR